MKKRTEQVHFRTTLEIEKKLQVLMQEEHRGKTSMIEELILKECKKRGIK